MRKTTGIIAALLFVTHFAIGQQHKFTVKDSINKVYDSLFYQLESKFIYRENVNWKEVKPYIRAKALKGSSLKEAFDISLVELFDTIQGSHLNVFSDQGWYKSTLGKPLQEEDFSLEFLQKYLDKPEFETHVIDNKYGYILIPGMLLDVPQDSINRKTQQMYDAIVKIAKKPGIQGWIIDLRMNIGGNVFPMLASLHYFLGDNTMYTVLSPEDDIMQIHKLKDGGIYEENELRAKADISIAPNVEIPVVFITGLMTASAGELIPLSFRGRKNIMTIGESTYGLLSGNDMTKLPFDVKLTLTTGYLADRKGHYTKNIEPDTFVSKKDNYTDISKDDNIITAIRYIKSKKR